MDLLDWLIYGSLGTGVILSIRLGILHSRTYRGAIIHSIINMIWMPIMIAMYTFCVVLFLPLLSLEILRIPGERDSSSDNDRSRYIPKKVREFVFHRDGGMCANSECKTMISYSGLSLVMYNLEFDHIIPFARGGSNTEANVQLLCRACNRAKGAKSSHIDINL